MTSVIKITVQIICYNQQYVIRRCLNSVLLQKEFVKEILVFDDSSTDNTIKILNEYKRKHPKLITVVQSNQNLGVFGNIERRWKYRTDGLVYDLSGDDEVPNAWFEAVSCLISSHKINLDEAIAVYGDYLVDYGKGGKLILKNSCARKNKDLWRLYQRGFITNRSVCYSSAIKLKYKSFLQGRSYISENVQDSQLHLNVERAIYLPQVGNIYHAGIGVSSGMSVEKWNQHLNSMSYSFKCYLNEGYKLKIQDVCLPNRNRSWKKFLNQRSVYTLFVWFFFVVVSLDISLGINLNRIRLFRFKVNI